MALGLVESEVQMQLELAAWLASYGLLIFEMLGVFAFALSGVIESARNRFDFVGIVVVASVAAFGGGTLRDLLLDRRPFFWVENEAWTWVLLVSCVLVPFVFRTNQIKLTERAMQWPDAVGLGVFAASGTQLSLALGNSGLVSVIMGTMTAVFGGVLRDVLINQIPRAFNDHQPYTVLAFAGGWLVYLMHEAGFDPVLNVALASVAILLVRVLAILLNWRLPTWRDRA